MGTSLADNPMRVNEWGAERTEALCVENARLLDAPLRAILSQFDRVELSGKTVYTIPGQRVFPAPYGKEIWVAVYAPPILNRMLVDAHKLLKLLDDLAPAANVMVDSEGTRAPEIDAALSWCEQHTAKLRWDSGGVVVTWDSPSGTRSALGHTLHDAVAFARVSQAQAEAETGAPEITSDTPVNVGTDTCVERLAQAVCNFQWPYPWDPL